MPRHPIQRLTRAKDGLIVASAGTLTYINSSGDATAQCTSHGTALIRDIATYYDSTTECEYVASVDEQKRLFVHSLPRLERDSERHLQKRANKVAFSPTGDIIVGDKFGDVYLYPLKAPDQPAANTDKKKEAEKTLPILGHVSMINDLLLLPASSSTDNKERIVTADRDEHVRISFFPTALVIDKYLFGSTRFVSALVHLPPTAEHKEGVIVAGGGDASLQVWDVASSSLLAKLPLDRLAPYLPQNETHGKSRAQKRKEQEEVVSSGDDGAQADEQGAKNFAVSRLVRVGTDGLLVLSSAAKAVLLFRSVATATEAEVFELGHPAVDICECGAGEYLVTLEGDDAAIVRIKVEENGILKVEPSKLDEAIAKAAATVDKLPEHLSLYPALALLRSPAEDGGGAGDDVDSEGGSKRGVKRSIEAGGGESKSSKKQREQA